MPILPPIGGCSAARGLELALVSVAITGKVDFSNLAPNLGIKVGDSFKITFQSLPSPVDRIANDGSGVHLQDGIAPFLICNETFALSIGDLQGTMGPAAPPVYPLVEASYDTFLSLLAKRPVNDAIFLSTNAGVPAPLPVLLATKGTYAEPFHLNFALSYSRNTIPSLHLKAASGKTYGSKGLLKSDISLYVSFPTNVVLGVSLDDVEIMYPKDERRLHADEM